MAKEGRGLLRVERCLIDEHDGDIVAHRVHAPALTTLQGVILFGQRCLAHGADQDLEKAFVDHFGNSTPKSGRYQFRAAFPADRALHAPRRCRAAHAVG